MYMQQQSPFEEPLQEADVILDLNENHILNILPAAVYVCDMRGIIKKYNEQAALLWGRRPVIGDTEQRFCGAYRLYYPDGRLLPHDQTPVAACLEDGLPKKDLEVVIERPDHSRVCVRVNIVPLYNKQGIQTGMLNCFYDITAQKNTEKELHRKSKELQDYVDNASIGLHWVDAHGIIKWANKAELTMLGYTAEEYIGQHISKFHVHREKIEEILARLSSNETLDQYESELRCKDGCIKTVHISSSVYREEGKFVHTRCFTVDVTRQRELLDALMKSERRYRELIQSVSTALYATDAEGRITLFNKAAADLWGREPEIGVDLWCGSYRIMNTDGSPLPLEECPMALCLKEQRPVWGHEIVVVRPDGTLRNVAPHPQPVFDETGKMIGAINMLIDITELKQTEKALRESEEKYRNIAASLDQLVKERTRDLAKRTFELQKSEERYHKMVEEVEDYAIILLDKEGIIQNWNKGAEKIKGYKEEEIVGKSFQEFYLPEDKARGLPLQLLGLARTTGKAVHEGWRRRKDGTAFWGSILLTALHNDRQEVIGFSKVTRDLTERKLAEDKMKEYLAQLEFQNKELEQFVYASSHDMKEPLRKILFYNSYIAGNPSNALDDKSRDYLNRSINAAQRMKKLIDDLLTYSKHTSTVEGYRTVDLNEVVRDIIHHQKEELEEKKISIVLDALPVIRAIPFQIRQLMYNLILNAIKYKHPDRDGLIEIRSEKVDGQAINAEAGLTYHKIAVIDNGIGFDPRYASRIFKIFQRLQHTPGEPGSGIGLAICKKIVQNHQGIIQATGKAGEGASFFVYLPQD